MKARWQALSPAGRARGILGVLGLALLVCLLAGPKPWSVEIVAGRDLKVSEYAALFCWVAALVNLVLTLLLAATASLWLRALPPLRSAAIPRAPRWFLPLVLLAMGVLAWSAWPRLTHSLWHDEAYPVRRAILGDYRTGPEGAPRLKEVGWTETFFFFKKPNHVLHSVICRASNQIWRFFAKPAGLQFNEVALRWPTYLAGIAAVGALALLLGRMGFFAGGALAAAFAALHPWMLRYASEARGYAFVLLLVPLLFWILLEALDRGRWRWWALFGLAEFLLLYVYPTTIYVLVVLNLCVPLALWWKSRETFAAQAARWLVANVAAAMLFLQLMLPCIPQFLHYVKETYGRGAVDWSWTVNTLMFLLSGSSWNTARILDGPYFQISDWAFAHPGLMVLAAFLAVGGLALGLRALWVRDRIFGLLTLPLLLPAILCYVEARMRGGHMYEWYIIFVLPGLLVVTSVGLAGLFEGARSRFGRAATAIFLAALVAAYGAWTAPARTNLRDSSLQKNRESVLLTRPTLNPNDPRQRDILTATFFGPPVPYDPWIHFIVGRRGLEQIIREADQTGKPLFLNLGYLPTVVAEHAHKYEFLKSSGFFDDLGILHGHDAGHSRHVFRYRPGSATGFDFDSLPVDKGSPGHSEQ